MKVGIDIGYSSVKVAFGTERVPETFRMPVGAGPVSTCNQKLDGSPEIGQGRIVLVNGEEWVGGVEPERLQMYSQIMDPSYPWTNEYRALYFTALDMLEVDTIDHLVTGLPVSQFLDGVSREKLTEQMTGRFYIRPDKVVEVKNVRVVPQPVGAWGSYMLDSNVLNKVSPRLDPSMSALVVDPGHYSLDWALYRLGWAFNNSGSTETAGDTVLTKAAQKLTKTLGKNVSKSALRKAVIGGAKPLVIAGNQVDPWPAIHDVAAEIVQMNLKELRASVRTVAKDGLDIVLVSGGGATLFRDALARVFDETPVVIVPDSILANSRGFYAYAGRA